MKRQVVQAIAAQALAEHTVELLVPPARDPQPESIHEHVARDQEQRTGYACAWQALLQGCDLNPKEVAQRIEASLLQQEREQDDPDIPTQVNSWLTESERRGLSAAMFKRLVELVFPSDE